MKCLPRWRRCYQPVIRMAHCAIAIAFNSHAEIRSEIHMQHGFPSEPPCGKFAKKDWEDANSPASSIEKVGKDKLASTSKTLQRGNRIGVTLIGSLAVPLACFTGVLPDAIAILVHVAEGILGIGVTLIGSFSIPRHSL
jgi:hypothetical protein